MGIEQTASNAIEASQKNGTKAEAQLSSEQWTRERVDAGIQLGAAKTGEQSQTVRLPELAIDDQTVFSLAHGRVYNQCVAKIKAALADPSQNTNHRHRSKQWISNRCAQLENQYAHQTAGSGKTAHHSSHSDGRPLKGNPSPGQVYAWQHSAAGNAYSHSAAGHAWEASAAGHAWIASHPGYKRQ
jgi:hypothetical protein